jgi:hypothetical protein
MNNKVDSKTQALLEDNSVPELDRHQRLCTVCQHPEREAIEEAFLQWRSVEWINWQFKVSNRNAIYRHAHATGLFARRGRRIRFALEHIIQNADRITPNGDNILRAIRAYTCLDDEGKWHEIPSQVIVSSGSALPRAEAIPLEASPLPSARILEAGQSFPDRPLLIGTNQEIENAATD